MAEGGGSAVILAAVVMVLTGVVFQGGVAEAATFNVGDGGGWSFAVSRWPEGKRFAAGDVLVFNYNPNFHNVVAVDGAGFKGCTAPSGAKVFRTGKDQIRLVKGQNLFICSIPGHCEAAMKISVTAA